MTFILYIMQQWFIPSFPFEVQWLSLIWQRWARAPGPEKRGSSLWQVSLFQCTHQLVLLMSERVNTVTHWSANYMLMSSCRSPGDTQGSDWSILQANGVSEDKEKSTYAARFKHIAFFLCKLNVMLLSKMHNELWDPLLWLVGKVYVCQRPSSIIPWHRPTVSREFEEGTF